MNWCAFLLVGVITLAGVLAGTARSSRQAEEDAASITEGKLPAGYRDWRLISVAHEEGDLHSFAAILGNDVGVSAYREGKLPFPDGTIIAALLYQHVVVGGKQQSLWTSPIVRRRLAYERPVYDRGFDKVREHERMALRSFQRRQTRKQRGDAPELL